MHTTKICRCLPAGCNLGCGQQTKQPPHEGSPLRLACIGLCCTVGPVPECLGRCLIYDCNTTPLTVAMMSFCSGTTATVAMPLPAYIGRTNVRWSTTCSVIQAGKRVSIYNPALPVPDLSSKCSCCWRTPAEFSCSLQKLHAVAFCAVLCSAAAI